MPSARLSEIITLPYNSPDEAILEAFDRDGAVIISDVLDESAIQAILTELDIKAETISDVPITALAAKSPTTVDKLLFSPQINRLLSARMCKTSKIWHGEERLKNTSRPYLSATVVFETAPGAPAQPLHRHDDIYFVDHPMKIPIEIWALVALDAEGAGEAGGLVDAILGSHRWPEEWDHAGYTPVTTVMQPGDCLLLHGSTIHRGGENKSTKLRRTLGASWTQGHMRQEENQFLSIPKEVAAKLDEKTQRLIGYKMNPPYGGWYELRDPITFLKPESEIDTTMREFVEREGEEMPGV